MRHFATLLLICNFLTATSQHKPGLFHADGHTRKGYILFSPLLSRTTYLIDQDGNSVHSWRSEWLPAQSSYLLPDGNLLRTGVDTSEMYFPKSGGWIELFDWNNQLIWSYLISDENQRRHHDVCALPNGHILALVWEKKTRKQAIAAGKDSNLVGNVLYTEKIIEIVPKGKNSADVVWEWNAWDHLVQEHNPDLENFEKISNAPELININFNASLERNWLHFNSISYNAKSDQVLISSRNFSEVFIIDHSTTTSEAASHKGGKSGKGGGLLYRWGNPQAYGRGKAEDQKLFGQHSAQWVENSVIDKISVFNNGNGRPGGNYSSVDIICTPFTTAGTYTLKKGTAYLPATLCRSYKAENPETFYSPNISSAQQLSNGHLLVCEGVKGKFFEVDKHNKVIWTYISPYSDKNDSPDGTGNNRVFKCIFYEPSYPGLNSHFKPEFLKQ